MITRRQLLITLGSLPLTLFAQPPQKVRRIGVLSAGGPADFAAQRFEQRLGDSLRHLGYEVGRNLVIENRTADGEVERLPALAEELVRLKVELIVARLNIPIPAAKRATRTIPIVMHIAADPVGDGYVESLAHPGGNITGTMWTGPELAGKMLQVLKEAVPGAVRIASLFNPTMSEAWIKESRRAATTLGMRLQEFPIPRVEDVVGALDRIASVRPDALLVLGDPNTNSRAREIAAFAAQRKMVSIGTSSIFVEAGGLIFYGPDIQAVYDRTASFIDRILRGAKPGDLPVESPTKYELVINLKTAKALGITIPRELLLRTDRVIE